MTVEFDDDKEYVDADSIAARTNKLRDAHNELDDKYAVLEERVSALALLLPSNSLLEAAKLIQTIASDCNDVRRLIDGYCPEALPQLDAAIKAETEQPATVSGEAVRPPSR